MCVNLVLIICCWCEICRHSSNTACGSCFQHWPSALNVTGSEKDVCISLLGPGPWRKCPDISFSLSYILSSLCDWYYNFVLGSCSVESGQGPTCCLAKRPTNVSLWAKQHVGPPLLSRLQLPSIKLYYKRVVHPWTSLWILCIAIMLNTCNNWLVAHKKAEHSALCWQSFTCGICVASSCMCNFAILWFVFHITAMMNL